MKMVTNDTYHYTESGLDWVYLADGFRYVDTPSGQQVVIKNIDGLHEAIGCFLVDEKKDLAGKDLRFLRHEMLMSQATLARLLEVGEQTVHRWETRKTENISKPAQALVRLLYKEHIGGNEKIKSSLKRIANLEDMMDEIVTLRRTSAGWAVAA